MRQEVGQRQREAECLDRRNYQVLESDIRLKCDILNSTTSKEEFLNPIKDCVRVSVMSCYVIISDLNTPSQYSDTELNI